MKRIFKFIEKYYFIIIILAVAVSLVYPKSFQWVLSNYNGINVLNLLLSIVLFTMGTTLKADDFVNVFKNPKEIGVGISAQYIIMPIIALAIAKIFCLDDALTVGLVLVGTVPGGTASDVITFLSKGDVALSVSLTSVSTVISPILTPWITLLLIGNQIHFNPVDMFVSIIEIVIIPIVLGLIIGANKEAILTSSAIIIIVIVLQYFLAMILGFGVGYLAGMDKKQIVTVAIELAFQNSGLSTSLAKTHFPNLSQATVPGALYSVWQNLAGSILAYIFRRYV